VPGIETVARAFAPVPPVTVMEVHSICEKLTCFLWFVQKRGAHVKLGSASGVRAVQSEQLKSEEIVAIGDA
jgi:hypothetical protein